MSSWNKASKVNQKTHRERHQPESRQHLGFLEKKKDYVIRAKNYNHKKGVLKNLRKQAQDRNPDEFYYHMINSQLVDGIHTEKRKPNSEETIAQKLLMENRNISYVSMKRTIEYKKTERLQSGLHFTDFANCIKSNHVHYDSEGEIKEPHPSSSLITDQKHLETIAKMPLGHMNKSSFKKVNKLKELEYKKLARHLDREKQLTIVQQKMEIQQALKHKSYEKPKLIKEGTKTAAPVYKWKYERKR